MSVGSITNEPSKTNCKRLCAKHHRQLGIIKENIKNLGTESRSLKNLIFDVVISLKTLNYRNLSQNLHGNERLLSKSSIFRIVEIQSKIYAKYN